MYVCQTYKHIYIYIYTYVFYVSVCTYLDRNTYMYICMIFILYICTASDLFSTRPDCDSTTALDCQVDAWNHQSIKTSKATHPLPTRRAPGWVLGVEELESKHQRRPSSTNLLYTITFWEQSCTASDLFSTRPDCDSTTALDCQVDAWNHQSIKTSKATHPLPTLAFDVFMLWWFHASTWQSNAVVESQSGPVEKRSEAVQICVARDVTGTWFWIVWRAIFLGKHTIESWVFEWII